MEINFILLGLLVLLVYFWSQELLGYKWALLPAFLTLFSPYSVEASPLMALALLISVFSFFNFTFHPRQINIYLAGMALGAAQLTGAASVFLYPYFLAVVALLFLISFTREKNIITGENHSHRTKIKAFKYFYSLVIIFLVSLIVFYLGLAFDNGFNNGYELLVDHFQFSVQKTFFVEEIFYQPIPVLVVLGLGALLSLIGLFSIKKINFTNYISHYFINLSLIFFIAIYLYVSDLLIAVAPALFILISLPIKNFMTIQTSREVLIVIAHELFSFSIKWLVFFILLFWYAADTIFKYLSI